GVGHLFPPFLGGQPISTETTVHGGNARWRGCRSRQGWCYTAHATNVGSNDPERRSMWPIRSALFVPAHRRDWVGKAIRVSPGAAVLDIEDSVPPQFKQQAMGFLKEEIAELRAAGVGAFVRVQPLHDGTAAEIRAAVTE